MTKAAMVVLVLALGTLQAQPRFEVASIRPSNAADNSNRLGPTPQGGLRGENVTAVQLIALAFGVRPFLIADAPAWASTQRFNITATTDAPDTPRELFRQRVQTLLTERFGLVIRQENRPMSVYKLVVTKSGHKLTPATAQEARRMQSSPIALSGINVDMKTVADSLAGILQRPVIDETNLSGAFNLSMQFDDLRMQTAADSTGAPTIFTAIIEQLGLKLEPARAPASVFVIEKLQRPSEN